MAFAEPNHFAAENRRLKVARYVVRLDADFRDSDAAEIAERLSRWTDAEWERVRYRMHERRPASRETREAIVEKYLERAERAAIQGAEDPFARCGGGCG